MLLCAGQAGLASEGGTRLDHKSGHGSELTQPACLSLSSLLSFLSLPLSLSYPLSLSSPLLSFSESGSKQGNYGDRLTVTFFSGPGRFVASVKKGSPLHTPLDGGTALVSWS